MDELTNNLKDWAENLPIQAVHVWREAMAQLRRLSDDVWNGLRFFLSLNGALIAASVAVIQLQNLDKRTAVILAVLAFLGFLVTLLARAIMTKQRDYYLQMLLKKSLLEEEMGFYRMKLSGTDLSFPWRVDPEYLTDLEERPSNWVQERRRGKRTVSRLLFIVYDALILLYVVGLGLLVVGYCKRWFE
jgi:hypothetical protein